ncbi:MAG: hypothetical protein J6A46_03515 [Clostridia bacterium]|nr:hypothetical protein [Clostridia bacterium]
MKDDLHFLRLWDLYSPLLTATQREITDLYFNYDLSLGEIAEQKGVSRQSVSDCLQKCRKQLEAYDQKLQFDKALTGLAGEYSAYMTAVGRWIEAQRKENPQLAVELDRLETALKRTQAEYGSKTEETQHGVIVGNVFRDEN